LAVVGIKAEENVTLQGIYASVKIYVVSDKEENLEYLLAAQNTTPPVLSCKWSSRDP
jgi:hypothetical protein